MLTPNPIFTGLDRNCSPFVVQQANRLVNALTSEKDEKLRGTFNNSPSFGESTCYGCNSTPSGEYGAAGASSPC